MLVTPTNAAVGWRPRINLAPWSEELDNAAWQKFESTVTADDRVAPNGTTTADKLDNTAGASNGNVSYNIDVGGIAGKTFTTSVWVYTTDGHTITLRHRGDDLQGTFEAEDFNLSTVANEWTRLTATKEFTDAADGDNLRLFMYPGVKDVSQDIAWFWGVQTVLGSAARAYQKTKGF